ncbi:hypothetical protein Y032_0069g351 [Ancylostoma ceylanicum]|uniref:Uncharacterized protein n=1 Tax=Ancylostoma ceylanicum TaxID=53326 RepID=A0A016TZC3_9BILA|nr:hypothetical protein Y032_0069g351 [Ancylostoma ceylanicum]
MTTRQQRVEKCRCCPYGFHIDVDFVAYAEDVRKGGQSRTPTLSRKHGDRLMSPLDSIFSDSLENILSDFDDALGASQAAKAILQKIDIPDAPPKPPHRSTTNGRATPSKQHNSAYTALGRTITEIKARNTESPFPEREISSRMGSRVGTPIDLGVPSYNGNASLSRPRTPHRLETDRDQKFFSESPLERPYQLPSSPSTNNWRRIPVEDRSAVPEPRSNGNNGPRTEFASLRRGREYAVSDTENAHRVRYYSASPKMPRKLQAVPPLPSASQFTYTHNNGNTMLAKTQGTSMSPKPEEEKKMFSKQLTTVGVWTGPLPPAKPCAECAPLRREVQELLKRLAVAEAKPTVVSIGTATEEVQRVEAAVGEPTQCYSIATETQRYETVDCGADALQIEVASVCQTSPTTMAEVGVAVEPNVADVDLQTDEQAKAHFGVNTDEVEKMPDVEKADQSTATEFLEKSASVDQETMTTRTYYRNIPSQTDSPEVEEAREVVVPDSCATAASSDVECQTETVITADSNVESIASDDVIGDTPVPECARCRQREETFTRNVGVGACAVSDKVCIECDKATPDEVDENDAPGFKPEKDELRTKEFDLARAAAVKKLLTSEQKQPFVRGTAVSRSARLERNKGDDLEYIAEKNKTVSTSPSAPATTPSGETADALKSKVVLKKEVPPPPSNLPDPIPARIPRPKISKYALPAESAETPDEEEEAVDRLTPLRSELRSLGRWPRSNTQVPYSPYKTGSESDEDSDDSEGSYDTHEDGVDHEESPYEISSPMREAMESLNSHLIQPGTITPETADWALKYVQHEWLKCAARKGSQAGAVDILIEQLRELSPALLKVVVNITDQNGNTALHYAVSHGNFGVVSSLLDSGECQLNLANRAGYSAVMLAALSSLENDVEKAVVQRLFELGDVNARAAQHGQTALMLSVSHGKKNTTELLLQCGAQVNLQDEEGSTALMCAAEHGHKDIVKLLLAQPGIDAALTDCDSSTALSIAVENGHRDIGVLIYAHLNYSRAETIEDT